MSTNSSDTVTYSLLDIVGGFSLSIGILAVILGIISLFIRNQKFHLLSIIMILSFALSGLGSTFYGFHAMTSAHLGGNLNPAPHVFLSDFSYATARAGFVLPSCSLGLLLVGIGYGLSKPKELPV